ncbi:MAG: hypothetical protein OXM55_01985 [Bdellovibrionales bacterium]|nr:hypothetical protein [Bdellovibrionales bacterium]
MMLFLKILSRFVINFFLFFLVCLNVNAVLLYPEDHPSENSVPSSGPRYVSLKKNSPYRNYKIVSTENRTCEFTAEVEPQEMFSLVKETYDDMCTWFTSVFTDHPYE